MSACFCPYVSFCLEFPFFSPSGIHLSRFISSITFLKPPQVLQPSRTMHSLQCLHCSQVRYAPRTDAIDFYLHWIIYRSVSSTHSEQLEGWGHTRLLFNLQCLASVCWISKDENFQGTKCKVFIWLIINNISQLFSVYYLSERMPMLSMIIRFNLFNHSINNHIK